MKLQHPVVQADSSVQDNFEGIMVEANEALAKHESRLDAIEAQPACRVYNSANISIPNNTVTKLTFDSERYDDSGMHSTSSNTGRITIATAGVYLITFNGEWANGAAGTRRIADIFLNNTTIIARDETDAGTSGFRAHSPSTTYRLAAGDYVEVRLYQNSGGALNMTFVGNYSPEFSAVRLCT